MGYSRLLLDNEIKHQKKSTKKVTDPIKIYINISLCSTGNENPLLFILQILDNVFETIIKNLQVLQLGIIVYFH